MRVLGPIGILGVLVGCGGPTIPDPADDTGGEVGEDRDQDGVPASLDCDDLDPRAYPGNAEVWDDRDNDCDGIVDGRGAFAGEHDVHAVAIFEGQPVAMDLVCPVVLERLAGALEFTVTCTPSAQDADAQRLLGAEVTVTPVENGVRGEVWEGTVRVESTNGWSADGQGYATWWSMDEVWLTTGLDTVSLDFSGAGTLERDE